MIKLYYIGGINAFDTPYFSSIEEQNAYYNSKEVVTINDSFYPPHYFNEIKLTSEDIDFNTQVDYLSIEFNDKIYYYFIAGVEYINQDLAIYKVTMDTIQTYMFNIDFKHAHITRRLINRFIGNQKNYNYIREGISCGVKKNIVYNQLSNNNDIGWLCFKRRENVENFTSNNITTVGRDFKGMKNEVYSDGSQIFLLPALYGGEKEFDSFEVVIWNGTVETKLLFNLNTYYKLLEGLYEDIYVLRSFYMDSISPDYVTTTITQVNDKKILHIIINNEKDKFEVELVNGILKLITYKIPDQVYRIEKPSEFYQNPFKTPQEFSIKYCPVVYDENYITLTAGDRQCNGTFPLSLNMDNLYLRYHFDILTGERLYTITTTPYTTDIEDKYFTTFINNDIMYAPLYTDAWKNYYATNIGTFTLGYQFAEKKDRFAMTDSLVRNLAINIPHSVAGAIIAGKTKDYQGMTKQGKNALNETMDVFTSIHTYYQNKAERENALQVQRLNMTATPDTERQKSSIYSMLRFNTNVRFYKWEIVADIENVAKQFESYGYQVNEYYTGNIFNECNTRLLYNIIKCEEINFGLTVLNDQTIMEDIIGRFKTGLRLWNVNCPDLFKPYLFKPVVIDNIEKESYNGK